MKVWIITSEETSNGELTNEKETHYSVVDVFDDEIKANKELKRLERNIERDKGYFTTGLYYYLDYFDIK